MATPMRIVNYEYWVVQAVEAAGSTDDDRLVDYARHATFEFVGIAGHDVAQFQHGSRQVVVAPAELSSGRLRFPYDGVEVAVAERTER